MLQSLRANRSIARLMIFAIAFLSLQPVANAALVSTEQMMTEQQSVMERDRLLRALEREDVRAQLEAMGVDPEHAKQRVAVMTNAEVSAMNARLDAMPAGAGVLEVALIVFLVLLFTDIMGYTDVFPFVNK